LATSALFARAMKQFLLRNDRRAARKLSRVTRPSVTLQALQYGE